MKDHGSLVKAFLLPAVIVILIVAHGFVLFRISTHIKLAAVVALVALVLLKHIGLFGSAYAFLKRRTRAKREDSEAHD